MSECSVHNHPTTDIQAWVWVYDEDVRRVLR